MQRGEAASQVHVKLKLTSNSSSHPSQVLIKLKVTLLLNYVCSSTYCAISFIPIIKPYEEATYSWRERKHNMSWVVRFSVASSLTSLSHGVLHLYPGTWPLILMSQHFSIGCLLRQGGWKGLIKLLVLILLPYFPCPHKIILILLLLLLLLIIIIIIKPKRSSLVAQRIKDLALSLLWLGSLLWDVQALVREYLYATGMAKVK